MKDIREELSRQPLFLRAYVIGLLFLASVGLGYAGYFLVALGGPVATVIGILIVEPLALASLLGLVTVLSPDSLAAAFFPGALRRASYLAFASGIAIVGWIIGVFVWIAVSW